MHKEFYDFLFSLRASGFRHHTPESEVKISLKNPSMLSVYDDITNFLDGEPGSLSEDGVRDLRNFIIGCNFFCCHMAIEMNVDAEYAFSISDYYINRADTLSSIRKLTDLLKEMSKEYYLMTNKMSKKTYGQPVDHCIHYIEQQLYGPLTAASVAEHAGLNQNYLSNLFKEKTGYSLYRYIQYRKIEEAKTMIQNTKKLLGEIAGALGYSSLPHFSKAFKRNVGISPQRFAKQQYTGFLV